MPARALIAAASLGLGLAAFAGLAGLGMAACSSSEATADGGGGGSEGGDAGTCPEDLPAACPATPPSYASEVSGIFERRCYGCHADGGVEAKEHDFGTYDGIFRQRSAILTQVYSCRMPPADAGQPTPEERAALLDWLVCKSPDN